MILPYLIVLNPTKFETITKDRILLQLFLRGSSVFFLCLTFGKDFKRKKIIVGEQDIKIGLIDSFPNHPYHVFDDTDMSKLVDSVKANGLLNPIHF